jgi:serralysin
MAYPTATQIANALLYPSNFWSGPQVTFSFPGAGASWSAYAPGSEPFDPDYAGLNSAQIAQMRAGLAAWDAVVALTFVETADPGQIRIAFTDVKDDADDKTWGYAFAPPNNGGSSTGRAGDIWIQFQKADAPFTPHTYDYMAAMHEMGHALGLKHPFEDGGTLPTEYDSYRFTIMSYTPNKDYLQVAISSTSTGIQSNKTGVYPTTPMVFDIAAIQARYGADTTTAAGNTSWTFDQSKPTFMTIYDAGGTDVIDLTGHSRPSFIDMNPGAYSSIDYFSTEAQAAVHVAQYPWAANFLSEVFNTSSTFTWSDNVGIALGTVIENVRAGSAADRVTGNDVANNISGGAGADTIHGAGGQDFIRGDDGADSITGGADFDDINGNRGNDTIFGGEGGDWVVGGQDNDLLHGENGDDIVYGNLGVDTVYGGAGNDWVRGGQGDDVLFGDAGNDFLSGDRGNDTITGGAGADRFNLIIGGEVDRVLDFNAAEGDRISIEGGGGLVSFSGGNAIIANASGDQIILVGVADIAALGNWVYV